MSSILKVDEIQNTGGTTGLTIDSSGFILPKAVAFQMHQTSAQSLSDSTETQYTFDASSIDTNSIVDLTNNRVVITAATAGLYWLSFTSRLNSSAPPRQVNYIKVGGSTKLMFEENSGASAGTTGSQSVTAAGLVSLSSGDVLTYHVYHTHGSSRNTETGVSAGRAEGYRIGSV